MLEVTGALISFALGGILALFHFLGLWWTLRQFPSAKHPGLFYLGSLMARLAVVLCLFFFVLKYFQWPQLLFCLAGFMLTRLPVVARFGRQQNKPESAIGGPSGG